MQSWDITTIDAPGGTVDPAVLMSPEHAYGLPRLDEESLVLAEAHERAHDVPERLVRPRGAPGAAVDDERLRVLRDVWIEVVQKHAKGRLRHP